MGSIQKKEKKKEKTIMCNLFYLQI